MCIRDRGKALVALDGDTLAMLEGLRDYLWNINGSTDIDNIIKAYFDEHGYDFDSASDDEYEDDGDWDDEDDWDDDDDW